MGKVSDFIGKAGEMVSNVDVGKVGKTLAGIAGLAGAAILTFVGVRSSNASDDREMMIKYSNAEDNPEAEPDKNDEVEPDRNYENED